MVQMMRYRSRESSRGCEKAQRIEELATEIRSVDPARKAKIQKESQQLEQQRKELQEQQPAAKKQAVTVASQRRIILNIGGQRFYTIVDTLTNESETYFAALLGSHFASPLADGENEIFIDRNPQNFGLILEHLRGKDIRLRVQSLDRLALDDLVQEAQFYAIGSLLRLLRKLAMRRSWDVDGTKSSDKLVIKKKMNGNTSICNPTTEKLLAIGDASFETGTHEWSVFVNHVDQDCEWIGVGVGRASDLDEYLKGTLVGGDIAQAFYGGYHSVGMEWWYGGTRINSPGYNINPRARLQQRSSFYPS